MMDVWHADSLAGPMGELKRAFESGNAGIAVHLTSGRSRELAERILQGEASDVFASSDPAVIQELFGRTVAGRAAAAWQVVFSANELVVITGRGNPLGLQKMTDLAGRGVRVARVAGEKDLATTRTLAFIARAAAAEGRPELADGIIAGAVREGTIPAVLSSVTEGRTDAGIVYRSAAVTVADAVEIVSFPAQVNMSDQIRNAVCIPGTARQIAEAEGFVRLLLSAEGRAILKRTGQPPIVPPLGIGRVPFALPDQ